MFPANRFENLPAVAGECAYCRIKAYSSTKTFRWLCSVKSNIAMQSVCSSYDFIDFLLAKQIKEWQVKK